MDFLSVVTTLKIITVEEDHKADVVKQAAQEDVDLVIVILLDAGSSIEAVRVAVIRTKVTVRMKPHTTNLLVIEQLLLATFQVDFIFHVVIQTLAKHIVQLKQREAVVFRRVDVPSNNPSARVVKNSSDQIVLEETFNRDVKHKEKVYQDSVASFVHEVIIFWVTKRVILPANEIAFHKEENLLSEMFYLYHLVSI